MKPLKEQLQQALRAMEFANAGTLAQLESMLESREAIVLPPGANGIEAARRKAALVLSLPPYRMPQAAGRH